MRTSRIQIRSFRHLLFQPISDPAKSEPFYFNPYKMVALAQQVINQAPICCDQLHNSCNAQAFLPAQNCDHQPSRLMALNPLIILEVILSIHQDIFIKKWVSGLDKGNSHGKQNASYHHPDFKETKNVSTCEIQKVYLTKETVQSHSRFLPPWVVGTNIGEKREFPATHVFPLLWVPATHGGKKREFLVPKKKKITSRFSLPWVNWHSR